MKYTNTCFAVLIIAFLFISCEKNNDNEGKNFKNGFFIINEGAFTKNNGSISFYDTITGEVNNSIFYDANGRSLGDVVQAMSIKDEKAFIVVNGSGTLEIVDINDFKISNGPLYFSYPRYFLPLDNGFGYLSNGSSSGKIYVIDLNKIEISDSIDVGLGPESIVQIGHKAYIANSGGWGLDSTISVIDINSNEVTGEILVGHVPVDMVTDADNNLWVQCKGYAEFGWDPPYPLIRETEAKIIKINPLTNEIVFSSTIGKGSDFASVPVKMATSRDKRIIFYLMPTGIFAMNVNATEAPVTPFIPGSYYGVEVNPNTDEILVFEAGFSSNGMMKIYNPQGTLLESVEVGIVPNGATFQ